MENEQNNLNQNLNDAKDVEIIENGKVDTQDKIDSEEDTQIENTVDIIENEAELKSHVQSHVLDWQHVVSQLDGNHEECNDEFDHNECSDEFYESDTDEFDAVCLDEFNIDNSIEFDDIQNSIKTNVEIDFFKKINSKNEDTGVSPLETTAEKRKKGNSHFESAYDIYKSKISKGNNQQNVYQNSIDISYKNDNTQNSDKLSNTKILLNHSQKTGDDNDQNESQIFKHHVDEYYSNLNKENPCSEEEEENFFDINPPSKYLDDCLFNNIFTFYKSTLNEYQEIEKSDGWNDYYQNACDLSRENTKCFTFNESLKHKKCNRYSAILPYDHNIVTVIMNNIDYFNASRVWLEGYPSNYIMTQGPLKYTTPHFWACVWEQHTRIIVMLTRTVERNMTKCYQYYPTLDSPILDINEIYKNNNIPLIIKLKKETEENDYIIRHFTMTNTKLNSNRDVYQYCYTSWPDFDVPLCSNFLMFLKNIKIKDNELSENQSNVDIFVHCSAGVGRTGTFVLIDSMFRMLKSKSCKDFLNSNNIINPTLNFLELRKCRLETVKTPEQLKFVYICYLKLLQEELLRVKETIDASVDRKKTSENLVKKIKKSLSQHENKEKNKQKIYKYVEKCIIPSGILLLSIITVHTIGKLLKWMNQ